MRFANSIELHNSTIAVPYLHTAGEQDFSIDRGGIREDKRRREDVQDKQTSTTARKLGVVRGSFKSTRPRERSSRRSEKKIAS